MEHKEHLVTQLLDEENTAAINGFELSKVLDPVIISLQDNTPIEPTMLQPVEQKITAMAEQVARLQELLTQLAHQVQQ